MAAAEAGHLIVSTRKSKQEDQEAKDRGARKAETFDFKSWVLSRGLVRFSVPLSAEDPGNKKEWEAGVGFRPTRLLSPTLHGISCSL